MRVATLQASRQSLSAILDRQAEQARLQSQLSSGLRVQSPGDDPVAAAQAELARSRLAATAQDQRANHLATSVLSAADGALGQGVNLLQQAREWLVSAADGSYADGDRQALAHQLQSMRDQLVDLANTQDGAGGYIFGGQGSPVAPLPQGSSPAYLPAAGEQRVGDGSRYATTVDGRSTFMNLPQGNGVFVTASAAGNAGTGSIGPGEVVTPSQLTGHPYAIAITGAPGAQTYTATDTATGTAVASNVPFTPGTAFTVDGQRITISGQPASGDSFTVAPAGRQSVFQTLDQAIALLKTTNMPRPAYNEQLQGIQSSLDRALDGMSLARSQVGAEMRIADAGASDDEQAALAATQRRSDLRDVDVASAVTQLQTSKNAMDAALQSYASMSKTTLFQLLG